ncbi:MAG: hypothetical protein R2795_26250 [Saprospiraceae bacterium]
MKILITTWWIVLLMLVMSATHPKQDANPESELTLLMREMFDDAMRMKKEILRGEHPTSEKDFSSILTAQASVASKTEHKRFPELAAAYLAAFEALKAADSHHVRLQYTQMVESCMNCHSAVCPGPKMRIQYLYIKE